MVRRRVADGPENPVLHPNPHGRLPGAVDAPSAPADRLFSGPAVLVALVVPVGLEVCAALSVPPGGNGVLGPLLVGPGPAPGPDPPAYLPFCGPHLLGLGPPLRHLLLVFGGGVDIKIHELVEDESVRL